jgi:hypothetical protein
MVSGGGRIAVSLAGIYGVFWIYHVAKNDGGVL